VPFKVWVLMTGGPVIPASAVFHALRLLGGVVAAPTCCIGSWLLQGAFLIYHGMVPIRCPLGCAWRAVSRPPLVQEAPPEAEGLLRDIGARRGSSCAVWVVSVHATSFVEVVRALAPHELFRQFSGKGHAEALPAVCLRCSPLSCVMLSRKQANTVSNKG
jgi:hypothetical protein